MALKGREQGDLVKSQRQRELRLTTIVLPKRELMFQQGGTGYGYTK